LETNTKHSKKINIDMSKSYSVFVENKYYYDFIALYNSWKYYENKIPLKVYVAGELDSDRRANIENGKMVVAREQVDVLHYSYVDKGEWDVEHNRIQSELRKYIGDLADLYTKDLITPTYNAGLIGFNKNKHMFLLEKSIEILTTDFDTKKNPISHLEQYITNLLIQLYSVDTHILPQFEWMNTWWFHKKPKKIIKIDDGKFALYNEDGKKVNFYHFTGGIGVEDIDGLLRTCRPHQLYESHQTESKFNRTHVEKLWYVTHENPVLLLYEYFANKGL